MELILHQTRENYIVFTDLLVYFNNTPKLQNTGSLVILKRHFCSYAYGVHMIHIQLFFVSE